MRNLDEGEAFLTRRQLPAKGRNGHANERHGCCIAHLATPQSETCAFEFGSHSYSRRELWKTPELRKSITINHSSIPSMKYNFILSENVPSGTLVAVSICFPPTFFFCICAFGPISAFWLSALSEKVRRVPRGS